MARTIVILHPGGFGDLLLAVPAIRILRERFPGRRLLLCGLPEPTEFLVECGLVDRGMSVQSTACTAVFGGAAPEDSVLLDWFSRCDLAVAWTSDETGTLSAALKTCGAAAVIVQSPFASTLASVHQSDRFIEIVHGQPDDVSQASLPVIEGLRTQATIHLHASGLPRQRPLALIHPGSGSRHKCVTPAVWLPVLEGLDAEGIEPILLEGPADHDIVEGLLGRLARRPILMRGLSIRLLAGLLSQVDLFLGHDSGVTHLAALVGTPTVALFGPTDPARWAPRGPAVTVVRKTPCACVSWDDVRNCAAKPCLDLSPQAILSAGRAARSATINPRIS